MPMTKSKLVQQRVTGLINFFTKQTHLTFSQPFAVHTASRMSLLELTANSEKAPWFLGPLCCSRSPPTVRPSNPTLGIHTKRTAPLIQTGICIAMLTAAFFTIVKIWKQPKCPPIDKGTNTWCIYTLEYYSAINMNEILPSATIWMDRKGIVQSEISQRQKSYAFIRV